MNTIVSFSREGAKNAKGSEHYPSFQPKLESLLFLSNAEHEK